MQASSLDTLLDRNFQTIDGFPERPGVDRPSGYPDELPDDRWGEIANEDIRPFEAPARGIEPLEGSAPILGRPLNDDEQSRVDRAIREIGFEAIAFYKSRRFIQQRPFRGKWGIFYLRAGVEHLAIRMAYDYGIGNSLSAAFELLRRHERYHFKADRYTMMLELVQRQQLYVPVRRAFRGRSTLFVEEALANRDVWTYARNKGGALREFTRDWMTIQPGAYARFRDYPECLRAEWAANTLDGNYTSSAHRQDIEPWVVTVPDRLHTAAACPEWTIESGVC